MISVRLAAIPHTLAEGFAVHIVHQATAQTIVTKAQNMVVRRVRGAKKASPRRIARPMQYRYNNDVQAKIQQIIFLMSGTRRPYLSRNTTFLVLLTGDFTQNRVVSVIEAMLRQSSAELL